MDEAMTVSQEKDELIAKLRAEIAALRSTDKPKVMVGLRCPRYLRTKHQKRWIKWWWEGRDYVYEPNLEDTPYRLDASMSFLIADFRQSDAQLLVIQDADCLPETSLKECVAVVMENAADGFGCSCTVPQSANTTFCWRPLNDMDVFRRVPRVEVEWITGGQLWLTKETALKMPVAATLKVMTDHEGPLYVLNNLEYGEDIDIHKRLRGIGTRICGDLRLQTTHLKDLELPSLRYSAVNATYRAAEKPPGNEGGSSFDFREGDVGGRPQ